MVYMMKQDMSNVWFPPKFEIVNRFDFWQAHGRQIITIVYANKDHATSRAITGYHF